MDVIHKIGRRKKSIARIFLSEGNGNIFINKKSSKEYFPSPTSQFKLNQPFILTQTNGKYDIKASIIGGGSNGQVEALRLAISKALCEIDNEFRRILKPKGLLTRDPRMVERKKFGLKKARKKFQFSKR